MNGDEAAKLKSYDDGQWRVYIAGEIKALRVEVKTFGTAVVAHAKTVAGVVKRQHTQDLRLAEFPQNCPGGNKIGLIERRVDELEKIEAGRKAVHTVLFSAGGVGIIGGVLAILKYIFKVI